MMKKIGVLLALGCTGLVAAVSVARPASTDATLQATVGPGYAISLTQNGARVTQLAPGTYTVDVDDKSDIHNFHLFGPGVDQSTAIEDVTTATWTVTLQNGTYTFDCDAHPASMIGRFTVGTATTTTTTTTTPAPPALKVKARTRVSGRTVSVTAAATTAASLDFGLWKGTRRVAHATARAKTKTVRLKAPAAGRYVAKVVAKAGGATARASARVTVK